jgi:hypothetical protein
MKYLRISSLRRTWSDRDEILLHASFQILCDFVDQEKPQKGINWEYSPLHSNAWKEISALYRWWKRERPNRRDPLHDKRLKVPPVELEDIPNSTNKRVREYDRRKYRAFDKALRTHAKLEEQWEAEDQRNLHRLIEVRPFLWT